MESAEYPLRVLHVFNGFEQGGIENFVMNVYRNIDREKVQFDFAFIKKKKGCFDDEALSLGGKIYYFDSEIKSISNYRSSLKRIIETYGPYVAVHSHMYFFSGVILGIAKECNVPVRIAHAHDTKKGKKESCLRVIYESVMRKLIKRNATVCIGCSKLAGNYVFGGKNDFDILYNGIDLNRFVFNNIVRTQIRDELKINNSMLIIHVGRFADQKNHRFIIEVFSQVINRGFNAKLLLIGDGPLLHEIEKQIQVNNLSDRVIILHNISNPEKYYNAADVFILPSKYEGMPIVSVEAQAVGLPTLISDLVTREVELTDLVKYLTISDTAPWVNNLTSMRLSEYRREQYNIQLEQSNFDITQTVSQLTNIYLSS